MDDPLTAAVLTALSSDVNAKRALAQTEEFKQSAQGWRECLRRLALPTPHGAVRFFYFQVLQYAVTHRWSTFPDSDKQMVRAGLLAYISDVASVQHQESYVKNAVAILLLRIAVQDFVTSWPSFFHDLMKLMPLSLEAVDIFLRVLDALDEEVVQQDPSRSVADVARFMQIKDRMRDAVIKDLMDTLYHLICSYAQPHPRVTCKALHTLSHLIDWIDIQYVCNDRFIPLLFNCLSSPQLQLGAVDCFFEIVHKRMDAVKKVTLIQQLRLLDVLHSVPIVSVQSSKTPASPTSPSSPTSRLSLDNDEDDEDFGERIAALSCTVALNIVSCVEKLPDSIRTATSPAEADAASHALNAAVQLLQPALELAFQHFASNDHQIAREVMPLIEKYVMVLKSIGAAQLSDVQRTHINRIIALCAKQIRYPDSYNFDQREEDEADFDEFRMAVCTHVKNLTKLVPLQVLEFVQVRFSQTLQQLDSLSVPEIEASLQMFHQLAEGIPDHAAMLRDGGLAKMMHGLIVGNVSQHAHAMIKLQYYELIVRYWRFFEHHPEFLGTVLSSFVDERGIQNRNSAMIRSTCCYLLQRLLKPLSDPTKRHMAAFAEAILNGLQTMVFTTIDSESPRVDGLTVENAQLLSEVMGTMMTTSIAGDKVTMYVASCMQAYRVRLENLTKLDNAEAVGRRAAALIDSASNLIKTHGAQSGEAKLCAALYVSLLQPIVHIFFAMPTHTAVRAKVIFFHHRLVDTLNSDLLQSNALQPVLLKLLETARSDNIIPTIELVNQLITRCKTELLPLLNTLFPAVVQRMFACFAEFEHLRASSQLPDAATSADRRVLLTIQRSFFAFYIALFTHQCSSIFTTPAVAVHLVAMFQPVVAGAVEPNELAINKTCIILLSNLTKLLGANINASAELQTFFVHDLSTAMLRTTQQSHFSTTDHGCCVLLDDICESQVTIFRAIGPQYLNHIGQLLVNMLRLPNAAAEQCCAFLAAHDHKAMSKLLRETLPKNKP